MENIFAKPFKRTIIFLLFLIPFRESQKVPSYPRPNNGQYPIYTNPQQNYNSGNSNSLFGSDEIISETRCRFVKGNVNKKYEKFVRRDEPLVYIFSIERKHFVDQNTNLRIEVEVDRRTTTLNEPVLFSVGQRKSIATFELPHVIDDDDDKAPVYYKAGRTLCIQRGGGSYSEGQNVTVRISTSSRSFVSFRLQLKLTKDFQMPIGKEISLDISPTTPRYLGFQSKNPEMSVIKIKASSPVNSCMTLSLQALHCPIYDKEASVRFKGLWQTMTTQAAMTVELVNRFQDGFVVVLVAHDSDLKCSKSQYINPFEPPPGHGDDDANRTSSLDLGGWTPRAKPVTLLITNESVRSGWTLFLVMAIPVLATVLLILVVVGLFRNRLQWMGTEAEKKLAPVHCGLLPSSSFKKESSRRLPPQRLRISPSDDLVLHDLGVLPSPDLENGQEQHNDTEASNSQKSVRVQWKADLKISDFEQKDPLQIEKSGRQFYWTIVIVAVFYCIPVYQLILHYLRVLYRTGEYDICYYNYLCAHRLGAFVDFNHVWSNVSYIIFGLAFNFLVSRRANCMRALNEGEKNYGIFYTMGIALAMEGVLSSAYHLCPNQSTFQFDTCFMYVISVLILLKIYQFRHSVHFGANHTFLILAAFVLISVVGLMFEFMGTNAKQIYRWSFIFIQFLTMGILAIYFYSLGYVADGGKPLTSFRLLLNLGQLRGKSPALTLRMDRALLPSLSFLLGLAVLLYCELADIDFATYLLYVLVANVVGATFYYVGIMKPLHGEFKDRTWVQPCIYFVGTGVLGGFAMKYFVRTPAAWELSAAASRAGNEECMTSWFPFYPYYDSHDVWHFLSAGALFLSFMALLIADDDLLTIPQNKIPVF